MRRVVAAVALSLAASAHAQQKIIPDNLDREPFLFANAPQVFTGALDNGATLASGSLRYGYTARLRAPFWVKNQFGRYEFLSDQEFYGVPFRSQFSYRLHGMVFCSPRTLNGRSWAACILAFEKKPVTALSLEKDPYLVDHVTGLFDVASSSSLDLVLEPNTLAQDLKVAVRIVRWSDRRVELVTEVLKEGKVLSSIISKVALSKGFVEVSFGAGVVKLRSDGNRGIAELVTPFLAEDSIVPRPVPR